MSDENDDKGKGDDEATKPKPRVVPKEITVRVLRAVDAYHHRNATLRVPNDEYHRGLVKQGNLRVVD